MLLAAGLSRTLGGAGRRPAPDFELEDSRGRKRRLSDFRGKVVVLNFWATWCAPCREEIPVLNRVHEGYSARGLTVMGIAMEERGWAAVTPFLAQHEVRYPVLLGNRTVARLYGGLEALPETVFVDRAGHIVATHNAQLTENVWREIAETLLAESPEVDRKGVKEAIR